MDALDTKLNEAFSGKVVRKDLLHRIKKGTNIPTFVLEFLLAKFCASDDAAEVENGIVAVLETLQKNYVRPDEANKAQSLVQRNGTHKFIDKVHVVYKEKEKRHWAELENFGSRRIAIPEKFYRDNDRLLEGGIWAEVTVAHNDVEDDDYAFAIESLKPIQLSKFRFEDFCEGRLKFTRDEWLHALIRSIGLEPSKMELRLMMHFVARFLPFVEANYNFIELGPRGTGKSYAFSEFSPYSTLVSQASTPTLFYNTARRAVGLVGFWDIVAFDEVGRVRIKDPETIDILKSYMASGRFSRGVEIVANASLAFVGNIDNAIDQVVNSTQHDLFIPLPKEFDLAVLDRFFTFLPGWEMPKNSSPLLTDKYGFITDYLSEAFHALSKQSRYDYVNRHCRFGPSIEGRDEIAVKRTVSGLLKLLHPAGEPAPAELEQYVAYALEGRRRVKEQLNKRKHDDEYAHIRLSYIDQNGIEVEVWCPESKDAPATQNPVRRRLPGDVQTAPAPKNREGEKARPARPNGLVRPANGNGEPVEDHYTIRYGDTGYSYEAVFGRYLTGVREIRIEDPYIRALHQVQNLVRFCETALRAGALEKMHLVTGLDGDEDKNEPEERFGMLRDSLAVYGVAFTWEYRETMHDREVLLDNGWIIKIGRGLDYFMKPENWFMIGATDMDCRPCLETKVDIYRAPDGPTPPGDLSLPPRSV